ncbi:MAG: 5-oxoprolinase subunit PxpB [Polyangia bacterium]
MSDLEQRPVPSVVAASDHSLLVRLATGAAEVGEVDPGALRRLTERLAASSLPGVVDVVPGYGTILLRLQAGAAPEALHDAVAALAESEVAKAPPGPRDETPRIVELPVCYGGEHGPDLDEVARRAGLSPHQAIARHSGADYEVLFLGFAPGFAYLRGLPAELVTPRLATPRAQVAAGSVAIAGAQAGIYPQAGPGGWRILGRTPLPLVRLGETPWTRLVPGDRVRFVPIDGATFARLAADADAPAEGPDATAVGEAALEVLSPGPLTTVQDLGRPGWARLGISAGGAADPLALRLANRLVGNPDGAAALELTLRGPELLARRAVTVALVQAAPAGAPLTLDGAPVPGGRALRLRAGQVLRCGLLSGGARAYLSVRGGLAVPTVCGSAATDVRGRFGGLDGRPLRRGDRLALAARHDDEDSPGPPLQLSSAGRALLQPRRTLRVVPGAQADWFPPQIHDELPQRRFTVTPQADRTGLRLATDPPLRLLDPGRQLRTEGVTAGALQVPADGQPILLGVEQQATGGYPKLAQVISADRPQLGRLRPGDVLALEPVTPEQARVILQTDEALLAAAVESSSYSGPALDRGGR